MSEKTFPDLTDQKNWGGDCGIGRGGSGAAEVSKPQPHKTDQTDGKYYSSKSGASSRHKARDFTLSPKELNEAAVDRFQYGLDKGHARNNWRSGKDDPEYQIERLNHAKAHLDKVLDGTGRWSDVQGVICNLAMLCWWRAFGSGFKEAFPWLLDDVQQCAAPLSESEMVRRRAAAIKQDVR